MGTQRRTTRTDNRARTRAFKRAAVAWGAGRPHQAWEILATSGFQEHWQQFQRQALLAPKQTDLVKCGANALADFLGADARDD